MSFKASLSLQVTMKPSPAVSKSAWGCRDLKSQELGSMTAPYWRELSPETLVVGYLASGGGTPEEDSPG
jgi:hypothetical protein